MKKTKTEKSYRKAFEKAFKTKKSGWSEVDQLRYEVDLLWKNVNYLTEVIGHTQELVEGVGKDIHDIVKMLEAKK